LTINYQWARNPAKRAISILILLLKFYSRRKKEEGRRKKEEAVIAMVSAIKNVLTVLAVAIMAFSTFFPL